MLLRFISKEVKLN